MLEAVDKCCPRGWAVDPLMNQGDEDERHEVLRGSSSAACNNVSPGRNLPREQDR
jgi:hypothetical protein